MNNPITVGNDRVDAQLAHMDALQWIEPIRTDITSEIESNRVRFCELLLGSGASCLYGLCEKDGELQMARILNGVAYQKYRNAIQNEGLIHKGFYR